MQVTDDGALPTGPRSSSANVTVDILDVNDHASVFDQPQYTVHVLENMATGTTLLTLSASDEDLGLGVTIANFILVQPNVSGSDNFKIFQRGNTAILSSIHPLDRSKQDRYILEVVAVDGGVPPLSSTATVTVIIDAVINNPSGVCQQFGNSHRAEGGLQ